MTDDRDIELLLLQYRPAGPAAGLRASVLAAPEPRPLRLWRYAAAAVLVVSAGLAVESVRLTQATAQIAVREPVWTPQAERAVALLGGDEAARKYVALALAREARRPILPPHDQLARLLDRGTP
jgi:hypothetical protein